MKKEESFHVRNLDFAAVDEALLDRNQRDPSVQKRDDLREPHI